MVSAAHNLGLFISTLKVLNMAGIKSLRKVTSIVKSSDTSLTLSSKTLEYFNSMPAGTARLAIAYEASKRLIRNKHAALCPYIEEFINIPNRRATVLAARASYHMEASYLTGKARANYNDCENERYLGRLGTFITTLYKYSSLAKSPYLAASRIKDYEDYDVNFEIALKTVELNLNASKDKSIEIMKTLRIHSEEESQDIRRDCVV